MCQVLISHRQIYYNQKNKSMRNYITLIIVFLFSISLKAQETDYYTKGGYAIAGYDLVSYFNDSPQKGKKSHKTTYQGKDFLFQSMENLQLFQENPEKYLPQYGGYCAYAIAKKSKKVSINPETYDIRDGKLYLFYNAWGTDTLKLWNKENPEMLQQKADQNWQTLVNN